MCCTAHSSEVLQIVERANKEVAIEALLNTFEEVWLSRQLELVTSDKRHLAINRQEVGRYTVNSSILAIASVCCKGTEIRFVGAYRTL